MTMTIGSDRIGEVRIGDTTVAPIELLPLGLAEPRALPALYTGKNYQLVLGDTPAVLDQLPAASIDMIFGDPPYFLSNGGTTCQGGKRVACDKGSWDVSNGVAADHEFHLKWLAACQRVLKPSGTIWVTGTQHVIFSIGFAMQQLGYHLLNTVTWWKAAPPPNLARRYFTHASELVIWAAPQRLAKLQHTFHYKELRAENGGKQMQDVWQLPDDEGMGGVWKIAAPGASEKREGKRAAQKPIALLDRIIRGCTEPGQLVLDPFNGSGTTGVVAVQLGREYIGVDLDAAALDLTERRIAALTFAKR